jgi:mannose-6-phosphate isomerase-like protein (cupin superfamily)
MRHLAAGVQNIENIPPQVVDATGDRPWSFRRLIEGRDGDPHFGALASAEVISWPEGFQRAIGTSGQLEWHPNHEEVFVLAGQLEFEGGAVLVAPAYFNHPPFWLHPTVQRTQRAVRLLRHQSGFPVVGFETPAAWDGQGRFATGAPPNSPGIDGVNLDDLPWSDSDESLGEPDGWRVRRIWSDPDDGWRTTLVQIPAGWDAPPANNSRLSGEEWFVLAGEIILHRGAAPMELTAGSHVSLLGRCGHDQRDRSALGCRALRWSRPGHATN